MRGVAAAVLVLVAIITPCSGSVLWQSQARGLFTRPQAGRQLLGGALAPGPADDEEIALAPVPGPADREEIALAPVPGPADGEGIALAPVPADGEEPPRPAVARKAGEKQQNVTSMAEEQDEEQAARAKANDTQFSWEGKGKNGFKWKYGRPRRLRGVRSRGEIVYEQDGVICRGFRDTREEMVESQSGALHAAAVAEAISYMCEPGPNFTVSHVEEIFAEAEAYAFAQAAVNAALTCKSTNAKAPNTCVSYTASATAMAEATASGHSEAVAEAVRRCPCMTDAVAASFASDVLFVELVADATVTAEATVCVEGEGRANASVWEECTSVLYAKLFAKAAAHAVSLGECLSPDAKVELDSYVDAAVTTENTPECDVEPKVNITGAPVVEVISEADR